MMFRKRREETPRMATFPPCGHCKSRVFVAIRHADSFVSAGRHYVRQHFQCGVCKTKARFVRRIDRDWTSNVQFARDGIQTY